MPTTSLTHPEPDSSPYLTTSLTHPEPDSSPYITLRIEQAGNNNYNLDIIGPGYCQRMDINMTEGDLKALNDQFQRRISSMINNPSASESLSNLAETGYYAFITVFQQVEVQTEIQQLLFSEHQIVIQVVSEDFFLSWELIYPIELDIDQLSYQNFWGINFIISRVIPRSESNPNPQILYQDLPRIGVLMNGDLNYVSHQEIPFFQTLEQNNQIQLFILNPLDGDGDPHPRQGEIEELRNFLGNEFHLIHFACHAIYDQNSPLNSYLVLSDNFNITVENISTYGIRISQNPLVFMNACQTSILNPLYTTHFVREFLHQGARGVVATEWDIPDEFAANFAEQFYNNFLAGSPLGTSLLITRQYF